MTQQWQFKIVTYKLKWKGFDYADMEKDLNDHGDQGWELVSTVSPSYGAGQAIEIAVVLKRPS